jgi:hypothetical protein
LIPNQWAGGQADANLNAESGSSDSPVLTQPRLAAIRGTIPSEAVDNRLLLKLKEAVIRCRCWDLGVEVVSIARRHQPEHSGREVL